MRHLQRRLLSVLLAFGFLVSCFSVDAFAADDSGQQTLKLSGGSMSVYWHSSYNGTSVSYGNFDATTSHRWRITSVSLGDHQTDYPTPRSPVLDATELTFDNTFHLIGGRKYYVSFQWLPYAYHDDLGYNLQLSFYDQYNTCAWTSDVFMAGRKSGANYFTYALLDCPLSFDVKKIRIRAYSTATWQDGSFGVGQTNQSWLNIVRLADNDARSTDEIVKAIQDQTAGEQARYDDFTSDGSQQGSSAVDSTQQSVSEKIGILDFAEGVLRDFIGLFSDDPAGHATLTLPGFKWHDSDTDTDLTVWEPQTFDFTFIEQHFGPLVSAMRVGTVLTVYGALLWYLQAVFDRIFGGGGRND